MTPARDYRIVEGGMSVTVNDTEDLIIASGFVPEARVGVSVDRNRC